MVGDAHIHLAALSEGRAIAEHAAARGCRVLAVSCTPAEYERSVAMLSGCAGALPALGLHPWDLARASEEEAELLLGAFERCARALAWGQAPSRKDASRVGTGPAGADDSTRGDRPRNLHASRAGCEGTGPVTPCGARVGTGPGRDTRPVRGQALFGEVGLDFYGSFAESRELQVRAFERVCAVASECGGVMSLHTRGAEDEALQVLADSGAADACTCILHGFYGGGAPLARALELGCLFSLGPRQMATRRGRAYAAQLPAERILIETDADGSAPQRDPSPGQWEHQIEELVQNLNIIRMKSERDLIEENWRRVFGDG